jgi:tetratricopeptide (TPR) repeat protein
MMNLGLLYNTRGNFLAQTGDIDGARVASADAAKYLDESKQLLDTLAAAGKLDSDLESYVERYRPLRLQAHRLTGQLSAGTGDLLSCEAEFRHATKNFPEEPFAWQMLSRVLEMQGKTQEAAQALETAKSLAEQ